MSDSRNRRETWIASISDPKGQWFEWSQASINSAKVGKRTPFDSIIVALGKIVEVLLTSTDQLLVDNLKSIMIEDDEEISLRLRFKFLCYAQVLDNFDAKFDFPSSDPLEKFSVETEKSVVFQFLDLAPISRELGAMYSTPLSEQLVEIELRLTSAIGEVDSSSLLKVPTILIIDITRQGAGWIRYIDAWNNFIEQTLSVMQNPNLAGIVLATASLDNTLINMCFGLKEGIGDPKQFLEILKESSTQELF